MIGFRLLLILLLLSFQVTAQVQTTSCSQTLRLAQSTYEQGRLHEIEKILEGCLAGVEFSKQERVAAYKILVNTYIYLEEPEKADQTMLLLLQTDHYFQINQAVDPAEFVALYNTFRTREIYRLGIKGGPNATMPNVIASNSASSGVSKYDREFGFQVGVSGEVPLSDVLTLNPEILYQSKSFSFSQTGEEGTPDTIFNISSIEKQSWISMPVSVQYKYAKGKVNPYASLGASFDYLLTATQSPIKLREEYQDVKQETIGIEDQRKRLNVSIVGSAGIKYAITGGYLVAEVRFQYGLLAMNDNTMIFKDPVIYNNYNFVDGIFRQNTLSFSVGYVYNIFKPKKKSK